MWHMRDIVGEEWFEVAMTSCDLYHGLLYAGRTADPPEPVGVTMRRLKEAAVEAYREVLKAAEVRQQRLEMTIP